MPWRDTRAAVHMAPARRPRSNDLILKLRGGHPQRRAAGRAIRPVAQPTEGDGAPHLELARAVAAKAVPDPVLELAES